MPSARFLNGGGCPAHLYYPVFLEKFKNIVDMESTLQLIVTPDILARNDTGFQCRLMTITAFAGTRRGDGSLPTYKMVDTCAAEFPRNTPYFYSTFDSPVRLSQ